MVHRPSAAVVSGDSVTVKVSEPSTTSRVVEGVDRNGSPSVSAVSSAAKLDRPGQCPRWSARSEPSPSGRRAVAVPAVVAVQRTVTASDNAALKLYLEHEGVPTLRHSLGQSETIDTVAASSSVIVPCRFASGVTLMVHAARQRCRVGVRGQRHREGLRTLHTGRRRPWRSAHRLRPPCRWPQTRPSRSPPDPTPGPNRLPPASPHRRRPPSSPSSAPSPAFRTTPRSN